MSHILRPWVPYPYEINCNECDVNAPIGNTNKAWPISPCVWPTAKARSYNPTCKKGETKVVLRCERIPWYGWPSPRNIKLEPIYNLKACNEPKCHRPESPCCKVYVCKKTYTNKLARSKSLNDITEYSKITQEANPDFNFDFDLEIIAYIASLKSINNFSL